MAASVGSPSPVALVLLAPIHLLPDPQLLSMTQPTTAPPPAPFPKPAPPPHSVVVRAPVNHQTPSKAALRPAARQRCSDFSVDFLLRKMAAPTSPAGEEDLRTRTLPLVWQQQSDLFNVIHSQKQGTGCVPHAVGSPAVTAALKRRRKLRTVFTAKQLAGLERTFAAKKYLSVPDRIKLAMELELTDTQVKTWFQNRRMKEKKAVDGEDTGSG